MQNAIRCPFSRDEVHVWSASSLDHEHKLDYFSSILSEDERKKARGFRFCEDKKHFIIFRGILRSILAIYLDIAPQEIEISYGHLGKPCLAGEKPSLFFNLSHSKNHVLYAIANEYEVGIDLEFINKNFDLESIVFNFFSPHERTYWEALETKEKEEGFFKIWVCKEAVLKALGKGWLDIEEKESWIDINFLKKMQANLTSKIEYPHYFNSIPGYASGLYVVGPPLYLHHYKYR